MPNQSIESRPVRRMGSLLNQNLLNIMPITKTGLQRHSLSNANVDPIANVKNASNVSKGSNKRPIDAHDALIQASNQHKKVRQSTLTAALENSMLSLNSISTKKDDQNSKLSGTSGKEQSTKKSHQNKSHNKIQIGKLPEITNLIERRIKSISLNNQNSSIKSSSQKLQQHSTTAENLSIHNEGVGAEEDEEIQILTEKVSQQGFSKTSNENKLKGKNLIGYYQPPDRLLENPHIVDHDRTQLSNSHSEPNYAWDIFNYYRMSESKYLTKKYLFQKCEINAEMRAVLVDWMVEVQESFEMNHETLYLAVKIMDRYLMKKTISKAMLQLLGICSLLVAAKFDERIPPAIMDFVFSCGSAYTKQQVIRFEIELLKTLDFFIGFPLSYRFLRRYARCCDCDFHTLTLARYILEMSLMDYELIEEPESKISAASLLLAIEMLQIGPWNETFQFYTGYTEDQLLPLMCQLNDMISAPPKQHLSTIRTKYQHSCFMEVAKIKPLPSQ